MHMTNPADTAGRAKTQGAFTLVEATGVILGRPLPHVQTEEQVLVPFTRRNAVYMVNGADARNEVVALEETGIDGTRISFLRLDSASLSTDEDATPPAQNVSANSERSSERKVAAGVAMGAVAGAVVFGLLILAVAGTPAAWWGVLGGIALGGALGGLWAGFTRLGASDAWERSLHIDPEAYAVIGVHAEDDDGLSRVDSVLDSKHVWLFGHDGTVLRRP